MPEEKEIGVITHYYGNLSVGIIKLKDVLNIGETIHIKGHTTDFTQTIDSMQIEHKDVESGKKGDQIGIRIKNHVREHDVVYKVTE